MEESSNNCAVKIAVRARPIFNALEENESVISYPAPELNSKTLIVDERPFTFDHVLGPTVGQQQLYEVLIRPLVAKVKQGFNCTAMAYGQTGTGKSFSMGLDLNNFEGDHVGVIPRCLQEIIDAKDEPENNCTQYDLSASFIEIYNEKIYDLLAENPMEPVTARDFKYVGVTRAVLTSVVDCCGILSNGTKNRHVRPTKMNSQSSRSHAIFTIHIRTTSMQSGAITNAACLNLVDLAGSEGVRRTGNQGVAMSEGVHINQGLLCIGKVLQAMVMGNKVIPYRDSVLSSVLQDSLSPNSYLTLLACISPCREDLSETLNTLRFAQNAKHLRHAPHVNNIIAEIKKNRVKTPHQINPLQSRNGQTPGNRPTAATKSGVKRQAPLFHSNTFSTPKKICKPSDANIFNHTEMGMTPKEKQKAQQIRSARTMLLKRTTSAAPFDYTNNRDSLFDHTVESRSSIMSFDISTSTAIDAPTANKPYGYSPVVRQCVAEMETALENKMQQMFETLKSMNFQCSNHMESTVALHTPLTPAQAQTTQMFPDTIRQELKSMMQELLASNASEQKLKSQTSEVPLATSSPVFKMPNVPKITARKGNLNFDSSLEFISNTSREDAEVSKQQKLNCDTQPSYFCVAEQTVINKPVLAPPPIRRSVRIADRTMTYNETVLIDNSLIDQHTTSLHRRSTIITDFNVATTQRSTKSEKKKITKSATTTLNNSVIASYINNGGEGAHTMKLPKANRIAKHRKAILDFLNKGSMKELQLLPLVGPKTAYQIVTHRVLNGKFKNINEVENLPVWRGKSWERFTQANNLQ